MADVIQFWEMSTHRAGNISMNYEMVGTILSNLLLNLRSPRDYVGSFAPVVLP